MSYLTNCILLFKHIKLAYTALIHLRELLKKLVDVNQLTSSIVNQLTGFGVNRLITLYLTTKNSNNFKRETEDDIASKMTV